MCSRASGCSRARSCHASERAGDVLFGTADVDALAARAPVMERLDTEPLVLPGMWVLQVTYEMPGAAREVLLPPALHPGHPPLLSWTCLRLTSGRPVSSAPSRP